MSYKDDLLNQLQDEIEHPLNEFDKEIAKNRGYLSTLSVDDLSAIEMLRIKTKELFNKMNYSHKDMRLLTESNEGFNYDVVTETENCFATLRFIFDKVK